MIKKLSFAVVSFVVLGILSAAGAFAISAIKSYAKDQVEAVIAEKKLASNSDLLKLSGKIDKNSSKIEDVDGAIIQLDKKVVVLDAKIDEQKPILNNILRALMRNPNDL